MKNTHGEVLLLAKLQAATLLKETLLHGCFLCFLNCKSGTKSRNASHILNYSITFESCNVVSITTRDNVHFEVYIFYRIDLTLWIIMKLSWLIHIVMGNIFWEYFTRVWGFGSKYSPLFNLPTCRNLPKTNYDEFVAFYSFESVY